MIEWLQFILGAVCIAVGVAIAIIATYGVFRFKFVLNRMHVAALGDTMGIFLVMLGLMIINGFTFATLKLLLIVIFFWCASPVSGHLLSRMEMTVDWEHVTEECEVDE